MLITDLLFEALRWLLVAFFGGQALIFIGLILWVTWTDAIKPRLIPAAEILHVADDIIANYPDPEEEAFARHERAWYRSDGAGQTILASGAEGRQEAPGAVVRPLFE